ncbi:MAG: hypothetical protein HYT81_08360 [Gemmatimonadetes bacterium]|nr:hypothetical protein [Gemmatimonadota bacterium]
MDPWACGGKAARGVAYPDIVRDECLTKGQRKALPRLAAAERAAADDASTRSELEHLR